MYFANVRPDDIEIAVKREESPRIARNGRLTPYQDRIRDAMAQSRGKDQRACGLAYGNLSSARRQRCPATHLCQPTCRIRGQGERTMPARALPWQHNSA
jgi:hypothetical protein